MLLFIIGVFSMVAIPEVEKPLLEFIKEESSGAFSVITEMEGLS